MDQRNEKPNRSFRLISVNFKEAALDSPSFRASINHSDGQLNNISHWVTALASSLTKMPKRVQELRVFVNSFTEHLLPSFSEDGILDQEITVPFLKDVSFCNSQLYKLCIAYMSVNTKPIMELSDRLSTMLSTYQSAKAQFDSTQEKYDKYLDIFMSSPKTKNPQMAVEDSLQLFITRKAYLRASLDLVDLINNISADLDSQFIQMGILLWSEKLRIGGSNNNFMSRFEKETCRIKRTGAWAKAYESAMKKFAASVKGARSQVEESSVELFEPTKNYSDYNSSLINNYSLQDINEPSCEKHGYLLMKTWVGTSAKPIWVKRWVFIKGGLFGMLVLSPSKTFVQETDKIGVLLTSTRYAAQEERRFCFEVKTSDMTITFQAEALLELKSWLKVFENEKSRVLSEGVDSQAVTIASFRYPPLITEFASTIDTLVDKQLTNTRIKDNNGQIVTSSTLSTRIKLDEKYFQKYLYHQIPLIKPPLMTSNTKTAIISYSIAAATALPTALTANTWGSVNWGIYYLQKLLSDNLSTDQTDDSELLIDSKPSARNNYPEGYPPYLVSLDIEMRALFESELDIGELCLLTFTCLWSPNSNQELCSRVFITNKNILMCNQALGFRSLFKSGFNRLTAVECFPQEDYEDLKIHFITDSITVKVYIEDGHIVERQLQFLIDNKTEDNPKPIEEVIRSLEQIRVDSTECSTHSSASVPLSVANEIPSVVKTNEGPEAQYYRVGYDNIDTIRQEAKFPVSPKAVFHILFGDNSTLLRDLDGIIVLDFIKKPWHKTSDGRLIRKYVCAVRKPGFYINKFLVEFVVEKMIDRQYYNVTYSRKCFAFCGSKFETCIRFVIHTENSDTCKLNTFATINFEKLMPVNFLIRYLVSGIQRNELNRYNSKIGEACQQLGDKGPVAKAVYLYGRLSLTEEEEDDPPTTPICNIGSKVVIYDIVLAPTVYIILLFLRYILAGLSFLYRFAKEITAQRLLLVIIVISSGFNMFLVSKTTSAYWTVRQAGNAADKLFHTDPMMLQRAVYLKDLQELSEFKVDNVNVTEVDSNPQTSIVLDWFDKKSFVRNFENPINWEEEYFDDSTRDVAINLKKSFQDIGIKRHNLLIEFNILNQIEAEVAKGEYRNWLISELRRCALVQASEFEKLLHDQNATNYNVVNEGIDNLKQYCDACTKEFASLNLI